MVVDYELKNPIRSHQDLEKDNAMHVRKACEVRRLLELKFSVLQVIPIR